MLVHVDFDHNFKLKSIADLCIVMKDHEPQLRAKEPKGSLRALYHIPRFMGGKQGSECNNDQPRCTAAGELSELSRMPERTDAAWPYIGATKAKSVARI